MRNDCFVITAMKSRIAAHAAAFRKATQSPFRSDDEIGMLNLIGALDLKAPDGECLRWAESRRMGVA